MCLSGQRLAATLCIITRTYRHPVEGSVLFRLSSTAALSRNTDNDEDVVAQIKRWWRLLLITMFLLMLQNRALITNYLLGIDSMLIFSAFNRSRRPSDVPTYCISIDYDMDAIKYNRKWNDLIILTCCPLHSSIIMPPGESRQCNFAQCKSLENREILTRPLFHSTTSSRVI